MKKLLLACMMALGIGANAQISVGSGNTTNSTVPWSSCYGFTYSQMIYTKASINAAGNITSLTFKSAGTLPTAATGATPNTPQGANTAFKIYLGHTTKASFASTTDWEPVSNLTLVYDGDLTMPTTSGQDLVITLTTPFAYNNVDNLVIAFDENSPGYSCSYSWTANSAQTNMNLYFRSDTVNPDPSTPGTGTRASVTSFVTLGGLTATTAPVCTTISAPSNAATGVSVTPTITWSAAGGANSYDLAIGTTAGGTDVMALTNVGNVTSYTVPVANALGYNSTYYVTVYPKNAIGSATGCNSNSFTTTSTVPCPTVTAPAASATDLSLTPTFTWNAVPNATSYKISMGTTSGGTDLMNAVDVGNVTTYTYSGSPALTAGTKYYYTINAVAGALSSASCTVRDFTTLCTGSYPAPFLQDFNSGTLPVCWSTFSTNNTGYALWRFSGAADYGTTNVGQAGGTYAWVDASTPYTGVHDVTLQSPNINLAGLTSPMLQFKWFKNHATTATGTTPPAYDNNKLIVKVREVGATTWDTVFNNDTNFLGWRTEYITLPTSYVNKTIEVQFIVDKDVSGNGYFYDNILIDDVQLKETPTCSEPSALVVSTIAQTSATLGWTAPATAPANGYHVYYSTSSTSPTASTVLNTTNSVSSTTTSATISGLTPNTTYYFWVRSNCGPATTDVSSWIAGQSFTTLCSSTTVPYIMNFDTATPPAIPSCITTQNVGSGNNWVTAAAPTSPAGFTGNVMLYSYNTINAANAWFFTQGVNLTAGTTYYISYKYGNNSTTYKENLKVAIGTGANAASMTTVIADYANIQDNTVHDVLNMAFTPTTTGVYYLGFNAYSIADQYYLYVDDVQITSTQVMATSEIAANAKEVKVYPNPFTDIVNISDINDVKNVTVVDMAGRVVKTIANPVRELHLGDLKSGMYILKIDYKDGTSKSVKSIKK